MSTPTASIDLSDVDIFARGEHHAIFDVLRRQEKLHRNTTADGGGFWALTRYDEVDAAYRDHMTFRSCGGAMLGGSFRNEADTAANRMLVASDPPRHRLLRQQMHAMFAPKVVERSSRQIETLVRRAIDRLTANGGGDFAEEIAPELPAGAVMAMFRVGYSDAHHLVHLTRRMIGFRDPLYAHTEDRERIGLAAMQSEIFGFFDDLVEHRRRDPGDDAVSILLRSRINGRPLSLEEVLYNSMNVAVGGNETSSYSACLGMEALMESPGQYDRLLASESAPQTFVDEVLRWSSTNAYVQRIATREVEIRGRTIRPGDSVTLWSASANRDASQFPHPNEFDIGRTPNRHLTFGAGIHRCIGASMGRKEIRTVFNELVHRRIRLAPYGAATRLRSNFILGITKLPVTVASISAGTAKKVARS